MDHFEIRMKDVIVPSMPESNIDFYARSGEITTIIGENGAGKTTLAKTLAGIITKTSGEILINDTSIDIHSISSARRHGIYMLQESLHIFPEKHIMDNLLLGIEPLIFHNRLFNPPKEKKEAVCRSMLKLLGLDLDIYQMIDHLSQGEKCLLQIGRILLCQPRILIMDEFSASLTEYEARRIINVLNVLKEDGICIILISHKYSSVIRHSDRIAVVHKGQITETFALRELGKQEFIRRLLTFNQDFFYPKLKHKPGKNLLTVKHISSGILRDISFSLQEGEILGIAGLVGSGRTTLIQAICKERSIRSGEIIYHPLLERSGAISVLPNESIQDLLFQDKNISFNITSSNVYKASRFHMLSHQKLDIYARDYMDRLSIRKASCHIPVTQLSQGEQQKVLIARALHQNSKLYILDEPSSNLDMTTKSELYNIYNALLSRGNSIILISSDFSELLGMCDRILLLKSGEQLGIYPADSIDNNIIYNLIDKWGNQNEKADSI